MKPKIICFAIFLFGFLNTSYSQNTNDVVKDSLTWHIYIGGKTSNDYINATTEVAKEWGLKTDYFYGDCVGTFDFMQAKFEEKNKPVDAYLVANHGEDWETEFQELVQQKLVKTTTAHHD